MQHMDVDAVDFSGVTHSDTHFVFSLRMDRIDGTSGLTNPP
jgi:hypothetical protein